MVNFGKLSSVSVTNYIQSKLIRVPIWHCEGHIFRSSYEHFTIYVVQFYGSFTLPNTDTETDAVLKKSIENQWKSALVLV